MIGEYKYCSILNDLLIFLLNLNHLFRFIVHKIFLFHLAFQEVSDHFEISLVDESQQYLFINWYVMGLPSLEFLYDSLDN